MLRPRRPGAAIAFLFIAVAGCGEPKPVIGKLCKRDAQPVCDGTSKKLACIDAHWFEVPCRGEKGCFGAPAQCDATVAKPGDACIAAASGDTEACSEDRGEVLVCEDRAFAPARPCRGPKRCAPEWPSKIECDETVGTRDEPCSRQESRPLSCSADGKAVLECDWAPTGTRRRGRTDGVLRLQTECPTPAGCKQGKDWAYCDFTGATVGTPCGKGNQNRVFCSPDKKAVLKCEPETLTLREVSKCPAGDCKVTGADGRTDGGCAL